MRQSIELSVGNKATDGPQLALFNPEADAPPETVAEKTPRARGKRAQKRASTDRDFPLWQRKDGRWCRKIRRRVHYFGTDKEKALEEWLRVKDDLLAGRTARMAAGELTVAELCNQFHFAKSHLVETGELSPRTLNDYAQACARVVAAFGRDRLVDDLAADDFDAFRRSLAKTRNLVGLANAVRLTRIIFKYAFDAGLTERPVRFGPSFRIPRRKHIRKAKAAQAPRMLEAAELRRVLQKCGPAMKAMVLLALNGGFGQSDCANLPQSAIDLMKGWLTFPRTKTGNPRRIPLWPETVEALRQAIARRPTPRHPADAELVFITKYGRRWVRTGPKGGPIDGVALEFGKLLTVLKLKRPGLNFYGLRHTFATISSGACDQVATNGIMGHVPESDEIPGQYRETIADERLLRVTNVVHDWLFQPRRIPK